MVEIQYSVLTIVFETKFEFLKTITDHCIMFCSELSEHEKNLIVFQAGNCIFSAYKGRRNLMHSKI